MHSLQARDRYRWMAPRAAKWGLTKNNDERVIFSARLGYPFAWMDDGCGMYFKIDDKGLEGASCVFYKTSATFCSGYDRHPAKL